MTKILSILSKISIIAAVSGCGILSPKEWWGRTKERTILMGSSGPQLDPGRIDAHQMAYRNLRRFTLESLAADKETTAQKKTYEASLQKPIPRDQLTDVRDMAFTYVDARCTAYLDAIFWARRTEKAGLSALSAGAAATGSVLAATSAAATTIGIVASAFGLTSAVYESSYEKFLYSIEPSGLIDITETAQAAYLTDLPAPKSEAQTLQQVQGYILLCTPVKIEALVNEAVKGSTIVKRDGFSKPLTKDEFDEYKALTAKTSFTPAEAELLAFLKRRYLAAGTESDIKDNPAAVAPRMTAGSQTQPAN